METCIGCGSDGSVVQGITKIPVSGRTVVHDSLNMAIGRVTSGSSNYVTALVIVKPETGSENSGPNF